MANEVVNNIVDKPLKTLFKTNAKLYTAIQKNVSVVYKTTIHQVFPHFPTSFYTTNSPLYVINIFHYSTYPTTITTKNIN